MSEDTEQPGPEPAAGTPDAPTPATTPPSTFESAPGNEGDPAAPMWTPAAAEGTPESPGVPPETPYAPPPVAPPPAAPPPVAPPPFGATPSYGTTPPYGTTEPAPPSASYPPPPPPPPSWTPPGGHDTGAPTPVPPTMVPFAYPPPTDTSGSNGGGSRRTPGRVRAWLPVAVVAAVIGGGIGAGVTALAGNNNGGGGSSVTIHESDATPGAAVLSGNVTIPQLVHQVIPAVVSIDVKSNGDEDEGTGMIITSDGDVVTNNHVIELYVENGNQGTITVTEYGQTKSLPTTLIGYDQTRDVALLKINNASDLPTVTFGDSSKAVVGDAVVAIGNALGLAAGTPTVTQGIVSALGRSVTAGGEGTETENLTNLIQTDAAINPGNSGGPLIDTSGQVIAMNTAVAGTTSDGTSSQNIGFAIPTAQIESLLPQLEKGGQTGNAGGYLGVDITTLTPSLRQQYGFTPTTGAVILSVVSGSPADKAGLVQGDVIVAVNGSAVTSSEDLQKVIQAAHAGQAVSITYYVGDSKRTTTATLGSQSQADQQNSGNTGGGSTNPFGGGGFPGFGNSGSTGGTP
jgi:S1-C subfamily serine protease